MSIGLGLWLQIATTVILFVIGTVLSVIGWYLRGEYREHKKNTAFRRYMAGDPQLEEVDDGGQLDAVDDRFDELRTDMTQQHADVDRRLENMRNVLLRVVELLEEEHDADLQRPDGGERVHSDD